LQFGLIWLYGASPPPPINLGENDKRHVHLSVCLSVRKLMLKPKVLSKHTCRSKLEGLSPIMVSQPPDNGISLIMLIDPTPSRTPRFAPNIYYIALVTGLGSITKFDYNYDFDYRSRKTLDYNYDYNYLIKKFLITITISITHP
jgi:hypothetical protein